VRGGALLTQNEKTNRRWTGAISEQGRSLRRGLRPPNVIYKQKGKNVHFHGGYGWKERSRSPYEKGGFAIENGVLAGKGNPKGVHDARRKTGGWEKTWEETQWWRLLATAVQMVLRSSKVERKRREESARRGAGVSLKKKRLVRGLHKRTFVRCHYLRRDILLWASTEGELTIPIGSKAPVQKRGRERGKKFEEEESFYSSGVRENLALSSRIVSEEKEGLRAHTHPEEGCQLGGREGGTRGFSFESIYFNQAQAPSIAELGRV